MFTGTVLEVQLTDGVQTVTFDVDRVWKGVVTRRQTVFRSLLNPLSADGRIVSGSASSFTVGRRYVVLTGPMDESRRAELGLPVSPESLVMPLCGAFWRFSAAEQNGEFREIGPGYAPE